MAVESEQKLLLVVSHNTTKLVTTEKSEPFYIIIYYSRTILDKNIVGSSASLEVEGKQQLSWMHEQGLRGK